MKLVLIFLSLLCTIGCSTRRAATVPPAPPSLAAVQPTKLMETRYDVRGYRDAYNPTIRHEPHAVFRQTRVPLNATDASETAPRTAYPPASYTPLPEASELNAELTKQKTITGELRVMKATMAEMQQRMEAQYGQLVRQSIEAARVREELETERSRLRSSSANETTDLSGFTANPSSEVKW